MLLDIVPFAYYLNQSIIEKFSKLIEGKLGQYSTAEEKIKDLKETMSFIRAFPIEIIRKLTFNEFMTRTDKMGLKTIGNRSKSLIFKILTVDQNDIESTTSSDMISKIKLKLSELERIFVNKNKPTSSVQKERPNAFELIGLKRNINEIEQNEDAKKIVFKHKEGYTNAIKRKIAFDFFL